MGSTAKSAFHSPLCPGSLCEQKYMKTTLTSFEKVIDLRRDAVWFQQPQPGYFLIQGEDRSAFLQRQTTNDIRKLETQLALFSVLTSATAHILDVFTIFATAGEEGTPALGVITLPGRAEKTLAYLQSRIFFMDRVQITNLSCDFDQFDLDGLGAEACLKALKLCPPQESGVQQMFEGQPIFILPALGLTGHAFRLLMPKACTEKLTVLLEEAGALKLSYEEYEILRVENGIPGPNFELTESYTPLEVGLHEAIADGKGCYTGQEIIARQITYGKIARKLVGLMLDCSIQPGVTLRSGSILAGIVTSTAVSNRFGPIALGVLRRPYFKPGQILEVDGNPSIRATVTNLPFEMR